MRPLLLIVGIIIFLLGVGWALQGAYVLPATFMRGPGWIVIGGGVAAGGLAFVFLGLRSSSAGPRST